jgi:hypothetical protein
MKIDQQGLVKVLGTLTKIDLVDDDGLEAWREEVHWRKDVEADRLNRDCCFGGQA